MGNGEWGRGQGAFLQGDKGDKGDKGDNYQLPMPNYQCPMPHAQFPMPHAPCPITNAPCPMPNYQFLIFCFWHFLSSITVIPAPANIIPAFGGSGTATDALWLFLVASV
ncbi:hypothetical protein PI95_032035 [Hassallia byssoidea VB512170]|uniref:Uncharacterized protein n=1 Tax=Hassallia byssoidea VB512170 TaxID=1304833 RepID=A0A846HI24_9CYAN|nr:hypothetical protein [Hassalia byssoidea]NEU77006.1 hypothetical protein [Hassalia byssoidea VB512170]